MPIHSSLSLVIDLNIWIYLYHCGLVNAALDLGELHVPDLMRTKELLTELSWGDLERKGVLFDELDSDNMRTVAEIKGSTGGVSVYDVACVVLAENKQVPLATNDADLYKLALKRHVPVSNFDAFLELLVQANIIGERDRQMAFDALVRVGQRPR